MVENQLTRVALHHGDRLFSAGLALETLGDLLGLGPSDPDLTSDEFTGLLHAVKAIGGFVYAAGSELYDVAKNEEAQDKKRGKKS
ncbi:hypothetical protein QAO71_15785 [Halopseudomonas sp. SMJS2]|uniref:hypothetical protein n=1 Tax=Halopseudomonas sp. SMJS2 TaxID=3041098 RepID=UPI00245337BD|nr:hypothetical protein [Halopseudomonas sp. SMJS2]WGK61486.1 hypothetical protein QAO71_15785 [Halopseudomonas sp. SMJS2]